jgi:serine/threonine protein kinase
MSSYNNYIYNELTDTFYILIYKLGSGSYSTVWFSLEFENFHSKIKNKKTLKINPRALKIHNEDCYEQGETEMEVNKCIIVDKKKSPYINYPLSSFIYDYTYFIVVYEVAIGSLYDVMKIFDKKLPIEFVNRIIPQLIKPIEFIHKCKHIHTDIKPENYLLMGLDQLQKDILEYSSKYNLGEKLKKIYGLKKLKSSDFEDKSILDQLNCFLKKVSNNYNLKNNILSDDSNDSNISDESNDNIYLDDEDNLSIKSFYSIMSNESLEEDYETVSSYDSRDNEYEMGIDNFHTEKVIKILFDKDLTHNDYKNNVLIENINIKKNEHVKLDKHVKHVKHVKDVKQEKQVKQQKYIFENYFKNPVVKLTDFGTMIKLGDKCGTIQTRYYRAPEIILGNKFNEKIDLWSIGCTIYELATGKILFYTCKDSFINKYDVDLINIRMMFEKIETDQKNILFKMIKKSNRKDYFINNNNCLNFFKTIEDNIWIKDLINDIEPTDNLMNVIESTDNLLNNKKSTDNLMNVIESTDNLMNVIESTDNLMNVIESTDNLMNVIESTEDLKIIYSQIITEIKKFLKINPKCRNF